MANSGAPTIDYSNITKKTKEVKEEAKDLRPRISFLGDSILDVGYGTLLPKLIEKDYESWICPENCRFVQFGLRMLFEHRDDLKKSDIIFFNSGLWDVCYLYADNEESTPIDIYLYYLKRIATELKLYCKKIVFINITPVRDENPYNNNKTIARYNEANRKLMEEIGVPYIDLFTPLFKDIKKYIRDDDLIHLTDEAIELVSNKIKDYIYSMK